MSGTETKCKRKRKWSRDRVSTIGATAMRVANFSVDRTGVFGGPDGRMDLEALIEAQLKRASKLSDGRLHGRGSQ
jgi:hypothetical protein